MLILLSLLLADDPTLVMMKVASDQVAVLCAGAEADCATTPPRPSYRIDRDGELPNDGKAAALAVTIQDCDRINKLVCPSKQRTVFATNY